MPPHPTSGDHDLSKLDYAVPKDASTQFQLFQAIRFFKKKRLKRFKEIYSIYKNVKIGLALWLHPSPGGNNLNNFESILPEDDKHKF